MSNLGHFLAHLLWYHPAPELFVLMGVVQFPGWKAAIEDRFLREDALLRQMCGMCSGLPLLSMPCGELNAIGVKCGV